MPEAIQALTIALFTAALALVGKMLADLWERHSQRRSMAAALAGEIGAYVEVLAPPGTAAAYRAIGRLPRELRLPRMRAMAQMPTGHPAFDKLAEKVGLLPAAEALEVSLFYNVVSGLRAIVNSLSTTEMAAADCAMQQGWFDFVADTLELYGPRAQRLVARLRVIAEPDAWRRRRRT